MCVREEITLAVPYDTGQLQNSSDTKRKQSCSFGHAVQKCSKKTHARLKTLSVLFFN